MNYRELSQESGRTMNLELIPSEQNEDLIIKDHFLSFREEGPNEVSELLCSPDCLHPSLTHLA